jgi:hypothetical protein
MRTASGNRFARLIAGFIPCVRRASDLQRRLSRLPASATVVERAVTDHGTAEAPVEDAGECMILVQKIAA